MGISDDHYCPSDSSEGASFVDEKRLFINQCDLDKCIPGFSTSVLGSQTSVCRRSNQIDPWPCCLRLHFSGVGTKVLHLANCPQVLQTRMNQGPTLRNTVPELALCWSGTGPAFSVWLNSWQFPGCNYGLYGFQGNMRFAISTY